MQGGLQTHYVLADPPRIGALAAGLRRETIPGNNPFLLHVAVQYGLQGVRAIVPFPQLLLNHGRDNPHYESCCGPETSENPTQSSLFTKWELYASLRYCFAWYMP